MNPPDRSPDAEHVRDPLDVIAPYSAGSSEIETILREAAENITAFADFPFAHGKEFRSTNPLERVSEDIKRRTDVESVFPNIVALLRLVWADLIETHDECQVFDRRWAKIVWIEAATISDEPLGTWARTLRRKAVQNAPFRCGRPRT